MIWSISNFAFHKLYCSPTNQYMIGCSDHEMSVISMDGHILSRLDGHQDKITSIAFANDASMILSGSKDKTIRLWKFQHHIHNDTHSLIEYIDPDPQDLVVQV